MAWKTQTGTKHTCNDGAGPSFGRLAPRLECKRCDELRFGAPARKWNCTAADADRARSASITAHFAPNGGHERCGPVCTFGDW